MTRNVFDKPKDKIEVPTGEYLKVWVPNTVELQGIFRPRHLKNVQQVSDTEFRFSGKLFKFLKAKNNRLFAKTKNEMYDIQEFIEKYQSFAFEDERPNDTQDFETYSYSKVIVEDISHY